MTTLHRLRCLAPPALRTQLSRSFWARLAAHYAHPPRAYHNLRHVLAVAEWFATWEAAWRRPPEVFAAVLFHDAVYAATRHDNEAKSALLARDAFAHTDLDVSFVAALIHATALSAAPAPSEGGSDLALFVDCDRAILGAAPADYARYASAIGEEYAHLPAQDYRRGRRAFLQRALDASALFFTPAMQERLGARARDNLLWELAILAE